MSKNDGGPAFPIPGLQDDEDFNGMSLRDYFAAKAMQAWLSTYAENDRHPASAGNLDHFAGQAYEVADAMIAARNA